MAASARDIGYPLIQTIAATVSYTDNGSAVTIGVIPAGGIVLRATAVVSEAFDAGTANVLDIGTSADPDGFATDLALGTIGNIVADEMATTNDQGPYASDTTITATPALSGTAATAGTATVIVEYIAKVQ